MIYAIICMFLQFIALNELLTRKDTEIDPKIAPIMITNYGD